jgi:hypothetical protein
MFSGKSLFWFSLCIDEELLLWENVGIVLARKNGKKNKSKIILKSKSS